LIAVISGLAFFLERSERVGETPPKDRSERLDEGEETTAAQRLLDLVHTPWIGDLDGMLPRRLIRILVTPSETMYFLEKGEPRGIAAEFRSAFETFVNHRYPADSKPLKVNVVVVPARRDDLLPGLLDGRGDIAASALTITPEREGRVDFSEPVAADVDEIVVTGPASPELSVLDDLAGKEVLVRQSSSYWEHLQRLNARFASEGKDRIKLQPAPEELEDSDLMEMVNAGLAEIVVVDDYKAALWAKVLPDITLHPEIAINSGGRIAWAMRKESSVLREAINAFLATHRVGTSYGNTVVKRYLGTTDFVKRATSPDAVEQFDQVDGLFRKYGAEYNLDHLLLLAQAYQESGLNPRARSRAGAVGIMQVKPSTGNAMQVGDIREVEPNIHAGIKYIRSLIDSHLAEDGLDELNRVLFAFAAYNVGPSRFAALREETEKRRLDPTAWFDNVELVVSDKVGAEPVIYVSNIFKYYVAFKLFVQHREARRQARGELEDGAR